MHLNAQFTFFFFLFNVPLLEKTVARVQTMLYAGTFIYSNNSNNMIHIKYIIAYIIIEYDK